MVSTPLVLVTDTVEEDAKSCAERLGISALINRSLMSIARELTEAIGPR
jgi:hypothetical protein